MEFFAAPFGHEGRAYYERPQSHVFSIHASALGGLRLELAHPVDNAEKDWGSSHMMALTWNKGTKTRTARQISAAVEGHAASLDGYSGRNTVGVQMTGLSRDWSELSELFTEALLDPTFPEDGGQPLAPRGRGLRALASRTTPRSSARSSSWRRFSSGTLTAR